MYPAVWNKTSQSKKQKRKNEMFTLQKVESHWWVVRKITNKIAAAFDSFLTCHQIWLPLSINRDRKNQSRLSILSLWWMTYTLYLARLFFLSLYQCLFCFVFSSENRKNFGFFTSGVVWLVGGETILVHGGGEPWIIKRWKWWQKSKLQQQGKKKIIQGGRKLGEPRNR